MSLIKAKASEPLSRADYIQAAQTCAATDRDRLCAHWPDIYEFYSKYERMRQERGHSDQPSIVTHLARCVQAKAFPFIMLILEVCGVVAQM